jgi:hypothetical protein
MAILTLRSVVIETCPRTEKRSELTDNAAGRVHDEPLRPVSAGLSEVRDEGQVTGEHDDRQQRDPAQRLLLRAAVQRSEQRALP